jgi:hypothetical protein
LAISHKPHEIARARQNLLGIDPSARAVQVNRFASLHYRCNRLPFEGMSFSPIFYIKQRYARKFLETYGNKDKIEKYECHYNGARYINKIQVFYVSYIFILYDYAISSIALL